MTPEENAQKFIEVVQSISGVAPQDQKALVEAYLAGFRSGRSQCMRVVQTELILNFKRGADVDPVTFLTRVLSALQMESPNAESKRGSQPVMVENPEDGRQTEGR